MSAASVPLRCQEAMGTSSPQLAYALSQRDGAAARPNRAAMPLRTARAAACSASGHVACCTATISARVMISKPGVASLSAMPHREGAMKPLVGLLAVGSTCAVVSNVTTYRGSHRRRSAPALTSRRCSGRYRAYISNVALTSCRAHNARGAAAVMVLSLRLVGIVARARASRACVPQTNATHRVRDGACSPPRRMV
jgi:hypothetical protein